MLFFLNLRICVLREQLTNFVPNLQRLQTRIYQANQIKGQFGLCLKGHQTAVFLCKKDNSVLLEHAF